MVDFMEILIENMVTAGRIYVRNFEEIYQRDRLVCFSVNSKEVYYVSTIR